MVNERIPRVTGKIFASNAAEGDIGQFGSALTGTKVAIDDISIIQALPAYEEGWRGAVVSGRNYPTLQEMNGLQKTLSQQINYLLQNGMAEWDAGTTYFTDQFCRVGSMFYVSLEDNNLGNNPTTTTGFWKIWNPAEGVYANNDLSNLSEAGEAHFANPDLSNLSTPGLDKINQSKALETGSVSSDADVYADVQKYAHSTFDLSKFEVVGSPNITDDGMASNLKSSNYILIPEASFVMSNLKDKSWTIKGKWVYTGQEIESGTDLFINLSTGEPSFGSFSVDKERLSANVTYKLEGETSIRKLELQFSELLTECDISFSFDINTYTYTATINGKSTSYTSNEHRQLHWIAQENQRIRIGYGYGDYYCRNATDLKSLSISIDGLPVFSGNKTGIDVIKPDNYEVVGTPTITDDGIASGFNTSNYLYKDIDIDLTKEVKIIAQYIVNETTANDYFLNYGNDWDNGIHFEIQMTTGFAKVNMGAIACVSSIPYTKGDVVKFILTISNNGLNYSCDFYKNGTFEETVKSPTLSGALEPPVKKLLFGILATTTTTQYSTGSIDLNTIQVWVDGDLVYQPCLKIPYTESKTGSKIVDAAYRDRVQDMYEQYGYAPYYTIDEENENFTLPMGEIYGMIERKNNELNNPFSLFDYKYTDAPIYNASWLKADGTFYAKSVYVSAYEALVVENNSDITAGTTTTLPSGGSYTKRGLSVKLSTASYTDTDFVINTTDETFRLPLTTKAVPFAGGSFPVVGTGIALGLTNARDSRVLTLQSNSDGAEINVNGGGQTLPYNAGGINRPENGYVMGLSKDSSKSGVVAKVSGTTGLNLYFYVGETVQNAYLIDAGQIAENIADKANADLSNCSKPYVTETYRNGSSGYVLWSDGRIEQWGVNDSSTSQYWISFLKAFTTTNYNVTLTIYNSVTGTSTANVKLNSQQTNRMLVWTNDTPERPLMWHAEGY